MQNLIPQRPVKLSIYSSPAHLPIVRAAVERTCLMLGFDSETVGQVVLSVDEALANVIKHAYLDDNDKPIEIELTPPDASSPRALKICLTDWGIHAEAEKIKSRDLNDVRPGGLGVHIITECMDQVDYRPRSECGTKLTMVKNLQPKDSMKNEEVSL